jgi:hypothetical protein
MLYIEPNEYGEIVDFMFKAKPYNEDINLSDIAALEQFYKRSGYLPEKYVEMFLNYVIYYARRKVVIPPDSPINNSFQFKCSPTASIINELMSKMGFKVDLFNVGKMFNTEGIHELSVVHIPVFDGKEVKVKDYLMDPTFRQFCIKEENRFERYFEEPRYGVRMSTPHPGYFFNLTKKGRDFANNLITYGYFLVTDDNLKQYFDPFRLYLTPKEEYHDDDLGKVSSTILTGNYYRDKMIKSYEDYKMKSNYEIVTPMERIINKKRRLLYRLKSLFGMEELYESNLELEKEFTK